MQKVESAVEPRPQATSQKKLFRSSPSRAERPSRGTGALAWTQEVEVGGRGRGGRGLGGDRYHSVAVID